MFTFSKYNEDTTVTFYCSTGIVGVKREETVKIVDLGWDNSMTDEETKEFLDEEFDNFLGNYVDMGGYTK